MSSRSLVSIITPFLNAEEFLQESIESALAQTYEEWELLLIDDGSTDHSTKIAMQYASNHSDKIRYLEHVQHQNLGGSAARNLGLSNAKGEFVAFLDADDVYLPNKLEDQVQLLESKPDAGLMYSATLYWFSWTGDPEDEERDWMWNNFGVPAEGVIPPPRLLTTFLRNGYTVPVPCSLLVRRDLIEKVGGFEDAFVNQYDDQVLYAKMCLESPVYVADDCWDKYRQHPKSSCSIAKQTGEADRSREAYLKWLEGYLRTKGVVDAELWGALRKALWPYRYPRIHGLTTGAKRLGRRASDGILRTVVPMLPDVLRRSKRRERRERG